MDGLGVCPQQDDTAKTNYIVFKSDCKYVVFTRPSCPDRSATSLCHWFVAVTGCFFHTHIVGETSVVLLMLDATEGDREKRDIERTKRQYDMEVFQAAAEDTHGSAQNITSGRGEVEATEGSASAFNPENPYHVSTAPARASIISVLTHRFFSPMNNILGKEMLDGNLICSCPTGFLERNSLKNIGWRSFIWSDRQPLELRSLNLVATTEGGVIVCFEG